MRLAFDLLLLLGSLAALLPAIVLFVEIVAGVRRPRPPVAPPDLAAASRLAVLVPAHDEAAGIEPTLRAVQAQLRPDDRCLVVADNCSDATAAVARAVGVEVVERTDMARRGKGFALDHGVRHLASSPPDVVVVVDADCLLGPGTLVHLSEAARRTGRPAQALDLMHAPAGAPLSTRIAAFAWIVRNQVRPAGAAAFGWPCQLMGTGMAFPWPLLAAAPLATGHLAEDMQLGLDLAARGHPPLFCPQARVTSEFPTDAVALRTQRMRWERGHLSLLFGAVAPTLGRAVSRGNGPLLAMALDLAVPPLAALVLWTVAWLLAGAAAWLLGGSVWPLVVGATALGLVGAGVGIAWFGHARHLISSRELLALPWYALRKIPLYVQLVTRRQVEWVRTRRHG